MMKNARAKLAERLTSKGLESNEMELFVRDVIRVVTNSPEANKETIKGRLHLLGWRDNYTDYGTIEFIQACYLDG